MADQLSLSLVHNGYTRAAYYAISVIAAITVLMQLSQGVVLFKIHMKHSWPTFLLLRNYTTFIHLSDNVRCAARACPMLRLHNELHTEDLFAEKLVYAG